MRRMPIGQHSAGQRRAMPELQLIGDVATADTGRSVAAEHNALPLWGCGRFSTRCIVVSTMRYAGHRLLPTISIPLTPSVLGLVIAIALF